MAINNANRFLFLWLLGALSAPLYDAQETRVPIDGASQQTGHTPALTPSTVFPELSPPKAPKVTCAGDQLAISADNATLGAVLAAVHACIGVQVDVPEGAGGSRVFEELGPGPARKVLESLLSGTDFNFVIGSSDEDPQKIASVLLMLGPKETASALDPASDRSISPARRAWLQSRQNRAASLMPDGNHSASDAVPSTSEAEDAADTAAENAGAKPAQPPASDAQPPVAEAPSSSGDNTAPLAPTSEAPSAPSPNAKPVQVTEQKIAEMQQLFQQRQQMNQTQNASPSPTAPQP